MKTTITNNEGMYAQIKLESMPYLAMIDTGAAVSLVSPIVAEDVGAQVEKTEYNLKTVDNSVLKVNGNCNLNIKIGENSIVSNFVVSPINTNVLIGRDLIKNWVLCLISLMGNFGPCQEKNSFCCV